ncbi:hypothetical protein [Leptospira interrogans]|nr:hypothetical protein [Leptospira interrogans]MCH1891528.1 hypothetical protein [Leptospira interrogans]
MNTLPANEISDLKRKLKKLKKLKYVIFTKGRKSILQDIEENLFFI